MVRLPDLSLSRSPYLIIQKRQKLQNIQEKEALFFCGGVTPHSATLTVPHSAPLSTKL